MPYILTGFDSAGDRHEYAMDDAGTVTAQVPGDELLTGWLGENPYEKPDPLEGETAPESGELTPSQMEAMRQHVSKLLTVVMAWPVPQEGEPRGLQPAAALTDPPEAITAPAGQTTTPQAPSATSTATDPYASSASSTSAPRYTQSDLEAMTATDLRTRATTAQIVGASSMTKAELVTALMAYQGT